ncbi:MAG: outer membrane beta-barrel protein [Stenotrophobium sp.]
MRKYVGFLATAGFALLPVASFAAAPTLGEVFDASGIKESGYLDASYVFTNVSKAAPGDRGGLDGNRDSFSLNQAGLTLSKQPTEGFGGLVNVIAGTDAPAINGAYGVGASDFSLTQAYLQYATGGWTIIGGRFVTLAGAEVIDPTQDANASRSLLFNYAIPLVHTGVRATYKFSDVVSVVGGLNNSVTGIAGDTNKQKTVELGLMLTPSSAVSVSLVEYYDTVNNSGGAAGFGTAHRTSDTDLVVTYQATKALSFGVNGDYLKLSVDGGPSPKLVGVALYSSYQFCDKLKGSLRGEYVKVNDAGAAAGLLPGAAKTIKEVTYTLDYAAAKNFDLLTEARYDRASTNVFGTAAATKNTQASLELKALYKF